MMLTTKLCLITGATSGIGKATAQVFVREGARVCATGRNLAALEALRDEIGCEYVVVVDNVDDNETTTILMMMMMMMMMMMLTIPCIVIEGNKLNIW
jgi:NADP-dependent 3-hydroxy acid dehydrogenase YdfG